MLPSHILSGPADAHPGRQQPEAQALGPLPPTWEVGWSSWLLASAWGDQSHVMSVTRSSVHAKWIVGKVIGTAMQKTAKVRVTRLVLDPYLLKYFNKRKTYFAHDALQQCTVGDIVLLKALPVPRTKHVKHELAEIVFKVGRVIDPVTGKPCAGTTYLESPVSVETAPLTKNLEELSISSTQ